MPELRPHIDRFPKWSHSVDIGANPFGDLWIQPNGTFRGDLFPLKSELYRQGLIHDVGNVSHRQNPHFNIIFHDGNKAAIIIGG